MSKRLTIALILVCIATMGSAQIALPEVVKKFEAYQQVWGRIKIHLEFNQEKYAPGDTAFFKMYVLRENLTLVPDKQLIDVALVDARGKDCVHILSHVRGGVGNNQLIIPDTLDAGVYMINAYVNWSKNFDKAYSFKKKINIVRKQQVSEVKTDFLHVAAEGGHLIGNLLNRVGVYSSREGVTILLVDETGQEVGSTVTSSNGTGSISFIPKLNSRYTAQVKGEGINQPLSEPVRDGCLLRVDDDRSGAVNVDILLPPGSMYEKELYVITTARGKVYHSVSAKQNSSAPGKVTFQSTELPSGLVKISLLDTSGKLIVYRDFYNDRADEVQGKVVIDQVISHPRDKVKLEVSITDSNGKPVVGEFSLRAINQDLLISKINSLHMDELTTLSEVKLPYTLDRSNEQWQQPLDHFLMVAVDPLNWENILKPGIPRFPSVNVIERMGKAYFKDSDKPLPDLTQVLVYLQKTQFGGQTFTVNQGSLSLTIPDFYGDDEFFYMAQILKGEELSDIRVVWEEEPFPYNPAPASTETNTPDSYGLFMERKRLIDQSYGIHRKEGKPIEVSEIPNVTEELEPDVTIQVDDYISFPSMSELIKEVIPSLQYRHTRQGETVRINLVMPMRANYDPLYIIDGIATKSTSAFLSLKPAEVKTIKIVSKVDKLLPTGLFGRNGVVLVETKNGNFRASPVEAGQRIKGLNYPLPFNNHSTLRTDPQVPDFRSTVYWNPSVKTDNQGRATIEFYNSDDIGTIYLELKGISIDAQPFSTSLVLPVELKK